jgi:hypothetical protein
VLKSVTVLVPVPPRKVDRAGAAGPDVISGAATNQVDPAVADERVRAAESEQHLGPAGAGEGVGGDLRRCDGCIRLVQCEHR